MDTNNELLGKAICTYAEAFQKIIKDSINGKSIDENLDLAFVTVVCKNVDAFNSVGKLLYSASIESTYFSVASIIRGALLNGIVSLYLANKIESEKSDTEQIIIREEIEKLYIDQIAYLISDLKYLKNNSIDWDVKSTLNYINSEFATYLKEPMSDIDSDPVFKHNKKRFPVKYLVNNSKRKDLSLRLLDGYIFYSKMDHLGVLSYKYYSKIYQNRKGEMERLKAALFDIMLINLHFSVFLRMTDENKEKVSLITKVIQDILKTKMT